MMTFLLPPVFIIQFCIPFDNSSTTATISFIFNQLVIDIYIYEIVYCQTYDKVKNS